MLRIRAILKVCVARGAPGTCGLARRSTGPLSASDAVLHRSSAGLPVFYFARTAQGWPIAADCLGMSQVNHALSQPAFLSKESSHPLRSLGQRSRRSRAALFLLGIFLIVGTGRAMAQSNAATALDVFGTSTPLVADNGDAKSVVLGVKMFSDVPGQVLGCSFYKAPTNTGVHVITLWDASGKVLATQTATGETASGKQTVLFTSPVAIAANQTFICGYLAPRGHYAYDARFFLVPKNVPPLHIPINGGVYVYGTLATRFPTSVAEASNYWVDVLFSSPASGSTWISWVNLSATANTANVTWRTSVPSNSQVEYGASTGYGSSTVLSPAMVTSHTVSVPSLSPGATYHFRIHSGDSDAVMAIGRDLALTLAGSVSIAAGPSTATMVSGATQQLTALVSNSFNTAVTWKTTAGTIGSAGLFTAPIVTAATVVNVTATSQADPTKMVSVSLTVNPVASAMSVSPTSLSFAAKVGGATLTPATVSITKTGSGSLTFTGVSDQSWLVLAAGSRTAPSTLQVSPAIAGLKAGTYTGHLTLTGGGTTKTVTVMLTMTAPVVAQHIVALSWKAAAANAKVVSYSLYRSSISGSSYGLLASAIGSAVYTDQSVQPAAVYYYVVTAVDSTGRESTYSNETKTTIP
jgi:Domain of unknown function (DUF4082)